MIYGPLSLSEGTRVCILTQAPRERIPGLDYVKFGTITKIRGMKVHVICDDNMHLWIDTMGQKLLGTLCCNAPIIQGAVLKNDILQFIKVHNTNVDMRTPVLAQEAFDNLVYDSIYIYNRPEDRLQGLPPSLIYPTTLRFQVGDILSASFVLEEFEVGRTDTEGFAKVVKATMKNEPISGMNVSIPTYTVLRSYLGISREDYNQHHVIRDVKVNGKQTMKAMADEIQKHVRKEFFDPYFR